MTGRRRRVRSHDELRKRQLWFGEPWPLEERRAEVCASDDNFANTPVGVPCCWCDELIEREQSGVIFATATPLGWELVAWHKECIVRCNLGGSMAHLRGMCSCKGYAEPDWDPREEALATYRWLQSQLN